MGGGCARNHLASEKGSAHHLTFLRTKGVSTFCCEFLHFIFPFFLINLLSEGVFSSILLCTLFSFESCVDSTSILTYEVYEPRGCYIDGSLAGAELGGVHTL